MANIHGLEGYAEARRILAELEKKTQKKVVLSILRKASKPIVTAAKAKVRGTSKRVARSIKMRQIRRANKLGASIKPGGKDGWFGHFIEFGTSGIIKKKGGPKRSSDNPKFGYVAGIKKGARFRKDQPARPFMRPAIDSKKSETKQILINEFKSELQETIRKYKK